MNVKRISIIVFTLLILVQLNSPIISAQVVDVDAIIFFEPDNFNYTKTINMANLTDGKYGNFETTIKPFLENNTDINGRLISPLLFPYVFETNISNISTGSFFRLTQDQIMSGSSQMWARIPIENLSNSSVINVRLYRSWSSPTNFNVTYDAKGEPVFKNSFSVKEIFNLTENRNEQNLTWHDTIRGNTVEVLNRTLNFTYFKLDAPLFSGDWYFLHFRITNISNNVSILFSPCDFGNDNQFNTWLYINNTNTFLEADLDTTLILTTGMGSGIAGASTDITDANYDKSWWIYNVTIDKTLTAPDDRYLNWIIPLYSSQNISLNYSVQIYNGNSLITEFNRTSEFFINGKDFIIESLDFNAFLPQTITNVVLYIFTDMANSTYLQLFTEAENTQTKTDFFNVFSNNTPYPYGSTETRNITYYGFSLFGYINFESSFWSNVVANFAIIYAEQPSTDLFLIILYGAYRAQLFVQNHFWDIIELIRFGFSSRLFLSQARNSELLFLFPLQLVDIILGKLLQNDPLGEIGKLAMSIGTYIWEKLDFIIPALLWIAHISVKAFYAVFVESLYFIGIFSTLATMEATKAFFTAKKGNKRMAFIDAINAGWARVYRLIALLMAVIIFCFSIVNTLFNIVTFW